MPQALRIALAAFALVGIIGLIGYSFARALRRSTDPARLLFRWVITLVLVGGVYFLCRKLLKGSAGSFGEGAAIAFMVVIPVLIVGIILTVLWAPSIGQLIASPFTSMFDGGSEELAPQPLYSIAEALRRRGKYREAIYAIQEQLNKFPTDFAGQMMLAEIQAENLGELPSAGITIHRICEQKNHPAPKIAFALNTLADWHMKYTQDADAAQRALEKIRELLPDTEFERTAANRIAHLGQPELLVKMRAPDPVTLKPGVEYLGLLKDQSHLLPKEKTGREEAAELVAQLDAHPLDHEARERLAIIYARDFGRLDFATDQLEQLIALPNESPKHVAHWLNRLADLQVEVTNTTEAAEQTLRRIIELYPNQSLAELAQQRLATIALELKRYEQSRVVKFGAAAKAGEPGAA